MYNYFLQVPTIFHNQCPERPSCTVKTCPPTPLVMMTFVLQDGRRPLYIASHNGHLGVVKTLMEAGANISQTNKVGKKLYIIIHPHVNEEDVHALPCNSIYGCVKFLFGASKDKNNFRLHNSPRQATCCQNS